MSAGARAVVVFGSAWIAACGDPSMGLQQSSLGKSAGLFSRIASKDLSCSIAGADEVSMAVTFVDASDAARHATYQLQLPGLSTRGRRLQLMSALQYQGGDSAPAAVEIERGSEVLDPNLSEDAAAEAMSARERLFVPLLLHKVRVAAARLCTEKCVEVPESTIDEGWVWCSVGASVSTEWTQ